MSELEVMSRIRFWTIVIGMAIVTFLLRSSFIAAFSYFEIPDWLETNMKLIPPTVLAAFSFPPLVYRDGVYALSATEPFLLAGMAATLAAWRTENIIATLVVGFGTFWVASSLF